MGFFSKKKAQKLLDEGIELHRRGRLSTAEEKYCESLGYDQNNASTHINYGDLLKNTKRPKGAEIEYNKAAIMAPELGEPHGSLAQLYHSQSRYEEAEAQYELALEKSPGNVNIKMNLAQLYMDTARYTEMKKLYKEVLKYLKDPRLRAFIEDRLK
ncbi:MAG: tetratricopeptide repeat protein [Candidatus Thermoplasmatota archaeon]|nr:tetratricopeptide repeat protein [Candidatus Thermoplasmatota archaeon]